MLYYTSCPSSIIFPSKNARKSSLFPLITFVCLPAAASADIIIKPPLFNRYSQVSQVLPVKSYDQNVYEKFIEELTNVSGKFGGNYDIINKMENKGIKSVFNEGNWDNYKNKLLVKVVIIIMFIPGIDYGIYPIYGPDNSAKSFLARIIKLIVNPSATPLQILLKNRSYKTKLLS